MSTANSKTVRLTQLALLIALEAVLFASPFGLINIPPVSITIMHIPVVIAAILLGPSAGAILGASFGLMALAKATLSATAPVDMLFSPFLSGNPLASLVMCLGARVLLGLTAAWVYIGLSRLLKKSLAIGISAALATIVHSLSVLGCLWLFFSALPLRDVFAAIISLNCILETIAAVVVSVVVVTVLTIRTK